LLLSHAFLALAIVQTTYNGQPMPPRENALVPFFGSIAGFATGPVNWLTKMKNKHGDVFTATVLGKEMVSYPNHSDF
jgi:hypothetical protein